MAMSGGVDSSVAAALLKKDGFDVVGVFMKFWAENKCGSTGNRCCTPESEKRARLVAEKLDIPFYVFNFEKEFKDKVVDYFLKQEKAGFTPNPCVVCNKEIKFGLLLKKAFSLDAEYIATGHYVKLSNGKLLKGEENKDQSYFLWKLNKSILNKTLFPLGDYTKKEVISMAKKFKLPVINIAESQEICFIQNTITEFLLKHLKPKPGKIADIKGNALGKHQGLFLYTIGQRKGIGLAGGPYYVLDKDMKKNVLIITKNEKDLYKKELTVKNINWISDSFPSKAHVKIRYRHKPALAKITKEGSIIKVEFNKAQRAITSGQSAVFYLPTGKAGKGKEMLGGGVIV